MFVRKQTLIEANHESLFLWGARQTGKSTLLKTLFPNALFFDLLLSDIFVRYKKNPSQFRELIIAKETGKEEKVMEEMRDILKDPGWVEGQPCDYAPCKALVQRRDKGQHKQAHDEHAFKFELYELGVLAL